LRFYVAGDDSADLLRASNVINSLGHNSISESAGTPAKCAQDLKDRANEFDCMLVFHDNPDDMCVEANRVRELRAMVYRDEKGGGKGASFEAAYGAIAPRKYNVIIFETGADDNSIGTAVSIISENSKGSRDTPTPAATQTKTDAAPKADKGKVKSLLQIRPKAKPQQSPAPARPKPKKQGLINEIKFTFGLDEEEDDDTKA
jgi:hypothetical protein